MHGIIHTRSQGLIDAAYEFAADAHAGQVRKYTGEPYVTHPVAVAKIVASVTSDCNMICAALLHDVIEDTPVTYKDIVSAGFGRDVGMLVLDLTDVSHPLDGNRKVRKFLDRVHTSLACRDAKTIKLADLIDNTSSITACDPKFAKVYMAEKKLLLPHLRGGHGALLARATQTYAKWVMSLTEG